jgi:hypothetical protein
VTASYLTDTAVPKALTISGQVAEGLYQGKIPDNQWVTEVLHVQNVAWANMQTVIADYAIGPHARYPGGDDGLVTKPMTQGQKSLCGMQKMRKSGGFVYSSPSRSPHPAPFSSFTERDADSHDRNINIFGLSFIFTLSTFFVLLDLALLRFLIFLSRFRRALSPRIERWIQDGVLQLQRRAYEAQDLGSWTRVDKDVPRTELGEMLPDLSPCSNPKSARPSLIGTDTSPETTWQSETSSQSQGSGIGPHSSEDNHSDVIDGCSDFGSGPNREDTLVAHGEEPPTEQRTKCTETRSSDCMV